MDRKAIAFFPWWNVGQPLQIGSIRLLPYEYKKQPGDLSLVMQREIDQVFSVYSGLPKGRVKKATLLELEGWVIGDDPDHCLEEIYRARELIAFSALAQRKLFSKSPAYCCSDTFSLVVQRYSPGSSGYFSYLTRRRDGWVSNVWSSSEFAYRRPMHVFSHDKPSIDECLLRMLLNSKNENWMDAIVNFNKANTDSNEVSTHFELIKMKSAFESLFSIGPNRNEFQEALMKILSGINVEGDFNGPLLEKWNLGPKRERPLYAWIREFCGMRGGAAHGGRVKPSGFVWSEAAHLAFASILFPLVLKKLASDQGLFDLSVEDIETLRRIDRYVLYDPFGHIEDEEALHPWSQIRLEVLHSKIAVEINRRSNLR